MRFLKLLIVPLFAAAFLPGASPMYSVPTVDAAQKAAQKERSAHPKKPAQFHYVCPMHEDVTSKKRGLCPKCKMKVIKKRVSQESAQ